MIQVLPFQNNPKDLDPSYKIDLDFWDCFGGKKISLSYKGANIVKLNCVICMQCFIVKLFNPCLKKLLHVGNKEESVQQQQI